MVYEAGPTGYGLARRARAVGIELAVCAPGKTDVRRRIGSRPTSATRFAWPACYGRRADAGHDPVGGAWSAAGSGPLCEDIRLDLMRARDRIGKFLLRREIYWEGPGRRGRAAPLVAGLGAVCRSRLPGDAG